MMDILIYSKFHYFNYKSSSLQIHVFPGILVTFITTQKFFIAFFQNFSNSKFLHDSRFFSNPICNQNLILHVKILHYNGSKIKALLIFLEY